MPVPVIYTKRSDNIVIIESWTAGVNNVMRHFKFATLVRNIGWYLADEYLAAAELALMAADIRLINKDDPADDPQPDDPYITDPRFPYYGYNPRTGEMPSWYRPETPDGGQ